VSGERLSPAPALRWRASGDAQRAVQDTFAARARIAPFVRHTPLEFSRELGAHLKLENLQRTGSFKLRGALNRVLSLSDQEKQRGVVAASAGNHAQGVAFGCAQVGVSALVVMPEPTPHTKVQATQSYGVGIRLFGATYDDAEAEARRIERESGRVFISPYNDPLVIAGQATIALEILQDLPDVAQVLVPVGSGGLISGVGTAFKAINPAIRVIGVTSRATPTIYNHVKGQRLPQRATIAEGLAGEVEPGALTLDIIPQVMDDILLVEEDDIRAAMAWLVEAHHLIAEGSGAVGMAALRRWPELADAGRTAVIVSGGNLDIEELRRVIAE
jgi:threonine dehydratase